MRFARTTHGRERGFALVVVMLTLMLVSALSGGLVLVTSAEPSLAANLRASQQVFYAVEAVLARAIVDLRSAVDWSSVLDGSTASPFADGLPTGLRNLSDGTSIDLDAVVHLANCGRPSPCSSAALNTVSASRPWGNNNPRWRLLAYGWLDDLLGAGATGVPNYVVALVGDDGAENDDDPMRDGFRIGPFPNPGEHMILVRGEAFGPRNAHYAIEIAVQRYSVNELDPLSPRALRLRSWQPLS